MKNCFYQYGLYTVIIIIEKIAIEFKVFQFRLFVMSPTEGEGDILFLVRILLALASA